MYGSRLYSNSNEGNGSSDHSENKMLKIDSSVIGRIIGPGGKMINELQKQHNVRINIDKEKNDDGTKNVEICGKHRNDVHKATEAINGIVSKSQDRSRNNDRYDRGRDDRRRDNYSGSRGESGSYNRSQDNTANPETENWDDEDVTKTGYKPTRPTQVYNDNRSSTTNRYLDQTNSSDNWDNVSDNQQNYNGPIKRYEEPKQNDDWGSSRGGGYKRNNDGGFNRRNNNNSSGSRYNSKDAYNFNSQYSSFMEPQEESTSNEPIEIDWDKINEQCEVARKERWSKCPPLIKSFYTEHPDVTTQSNEEVASFRESNNNIVVSRTFDPDAKPEDLPKPCPKFEHCFEKYPDLMAAIKKQGFKKPSPIQAQAWPVLLQGEDLIGIAQTGTGKTLAFLFPALVHIVGQPIPRGERGGPNVLVMAPTRELAIQIEMEVAKYEFRNVRAACLYGGGERNKQIDKVKNGVEIIIATPGRLNDLVAAKYIDIASITYLILDEADRMLDMGFEPQIRKLLLDIRPDRQTVMTSATWPSSVRRLASSYMNNPIQVFIGSLDLAATHTVTQKIEIMDEEDKYNRIFNFVRKEMGPKDKAIIFCGKKDRADDLSSEFSLKGIDCQSIHGNREQSDREQALADIKSGEVRILVATDVASRGIDIEDITYVINYDFPRNIEEYVHRVGRTGRAGRKGVSLSFMTRSDWGSAKELIAILEEAEQEIPDKLRDMAERFGAMKARRNEEKAKFGMGGGRGRGGGGRGRGGGGFGRFSN